MSTEHRNDPGPIPSPELGYDTRDFKARSMIIAAICFFGFAVASAFVARYFILPMMGVEPAAPTGPFATVQPPKGTPILQNNVTNVTDIRDLRQHEHDLMTTYGPLPDGSYRIPIEKALQLVAEQGLPKPSPAAEKAATKTLSHSPSGATAPTSPGTNPGNANTQPPQSTLKGGAHS